MNELERLFYEALKAGNGGSSENEVYEVNFVGRRNGNNLIAEKVKVKFKESGVKVTVPIQIFLTDNGIDEKTVKLLTGAISVLYLWMRM